MRERGVTSGVSMRTGMIGSCSRMRKMSGKQRSRMRMMRRWVCRLTWCVKDEPDLLFDWNDSARKRALDARIEAIGKGGKRKRSRKKDDVSDADRPVTDS
jgi:hypothetical protein